MGIRAWGWMVAAAALAAPGPAEAGGDIDAQRLKKVLRLPTLQLRVSFGFSSAGSIEGDAPLTENDPEAEIARTLAELKGDDGDASRYATLASLHRNAGDEAKAAEFLKKSMDLQRKRVAAQPENAVLHLEMAGVLRAAGLDAEAEKALRRSVALAPGEGDAWSALADLLATSAYGTLSGVRLEELPNLFEYFQHPDQAPPASLAEAETSAARARLEEAQSCADRSVAAAPAKPGPLWERWRLHMADLWWKCRTRTSTPEDFTTACDETTTVFSAAAAEFPEGTEVQMPAAIICAVIGAMGASPEGSQGMGSEDRATLFRGKVGKVRELAGDTVRRLEREGEGKDRKAAAVALETAAMIRMVLSEFEAAEADARKAFQLDPGRDRAWKILMGTLIDRKGFGEMAALCRRTIAARDTSFKRLVLAKTLFLTGDAEKAEEEIRTALKMDPRRLEANLALAVLVLLRAKAPNDFEEAGSLLARARETLAMRTRLRTETDQNREECLMVEAVHRGLTGDRDGASECVRRLRNLDPESKDAREIFAALGL